jgi:hypothetical protein
MTILEDAIVHNLCPWSKRINDVRVNVVMKRNDAQKEMQDKETMTTKDEQTQMTSRTYTFKTTCIVKSTFAKNKWTQCDLSAKTKG